MATASHIEAGPSVTQNALQDATLAFQGVLSDDQRRELLMMRLGSVPDADAILIFTAQLDKNRKGHSFATRLHRFLSSIRDFCGIVDTYVSAHPEIAALVWGSVKLTMMVVANFVSYYEATSNLFTTLGDMCPLFCEYHILFYDSVGLRDSLDNFYTSIIRCCRHVVMAMQRSWSTQLLKVLQSSFDQEFKPDLEDIQRHARKVESQIALAKAQADKRFQELQKNERAKASEGRAIVERHMTRTDCSLDTLQSFQVQSNREKSRKRARKLLDSLSTYNYSRSFNQSTRKRHGNTTNWIHETPQFQRWLEGGSSVVWCSGKIGCGKTIAAANAIKRVQQPLNIANTPLITYLFMQTDDADSLNAETVLRTLLPYIFIDGLDECDTENRRLLLAALSAVINAAGNIRLYISSRDSVRDDVTRYFPGFEHITLDCEATRDDIACYINEAIDEKLEAGDLMASDKAIQQALKDLPRDLAEVFQRVLRRINVRLRGSVARQVFPWVAAAKRPLSIRELREAIAIEIGQQYTEPSKLWNDMEKVPSWCENLIEIDEETGSVQFAHSAVRAFLVDASSDSKLADFHFDLEVVDHNIGEICVTYLHFNDFKRTLAVRQNSIQINPSLIAPTVLTPVSRGAALISGLITDTRSPHDHDLSRGCFNIFPVGNTSTTESLKHSHPFLKYASTYWIAHTNQFRQGRSKTWALWESIVIRGHVLARTPWNTSGGALGGTDIEAQAPSVTWACANNHSAIIRLLISHWPSSLVEASSSCNLKLLDMLLKEHMAEHELSKGLVEKINEAFRKAVKLGQFDIVDRLLSTQVIDFDVPINSRGSYRALEMVLVEHPPSPRQFACSWRREEYAWYSCGVNLSGLV
ncbi:Ankyrin repeat-containing domain protein [Apiospora saccharicola]|uniref:Ankyrin repeat-containing domain protein n=1 Tax=Apiospora saccharicola TaxID=335842 RepID=A0ABR1U2Z5_9PEZI